MDGQDAVCGVGVYCACASMPSQVYRLMTSGTIEEIKYIRQLYKTHLADQTLHVCFAVSDHIVAIRLHYEHFVAT